MIPGIDSSIDRTGTARPLQIQYIAIQYNTIVDAPYVTSESEAWDDDDQVGDEYAIANKSV